MAFLKAILLELGQWALAKLSSFIYDLFKAKQKEDKEYDKAAELAKAKEDIVSKIYAVEAEIEKLKLDGKPFEHLFEEIENLEGELREVSKRVDGNIFN